MGFGRTRFGERRSWEWCVDDAWKSFARWASDELGGEVYFFLFVFIIINLICVL